MMRRTYFLCLATVLLVCSCGKERQPLRSVYYWSTTFSLDSTQRAFIQSQNISRIYLRYFDVVVDAQGEVMPNATVKFKPGAASVTTKGAEAGAQLSSGETGRSPHVEIIPTIYIVNKCLTRSVADLDSLILQRVLQMNETNDVAGVKEIQIDCDWTARTREAYFDFLAKLRRRAKERGISLSATIRLHQLAEVPPPVDRGVLMMYNTGDVTRLEVQHPILDVADADPYLRHLGSYKLPLSAAYPVYTWRVVFRNGKFVDFLHDDGDLPLLETDSIVVHEPSLEMVMKAKEAVSRRLPSANDEIILFDLSNNNVQRIKKNHYEKVFNR